MDFKILAIILGVILVFVVILFIFVNFRFSRMLKSSKKREADDIIEKHGVRYSNGQEIFKEDGDINVSLSQKDFVLRMGETYKIGKDADLKPGKYTLLTSSGNDEAFNIRVSGLVREYHHAGTIVLADGDEITSVSHTVILR